MARCHIRRVAALIIAVTTACGCLLTLEEPRYVTRERDAAESTIDSHADGADDELLDSPFDTRGDALADILLDAADDRRVVTPDGSFVDSRVPDALSSDVACNHCESGMTCCNGECVDTRTSEMHCGRCGISCESPYFCNSGRCCTRIVGIGGIIIVVCRQ